jgi:hypothetical protein
MDAATLADAVAEFLAPALPYLLKLAGKGAEEAAGELGKESANKAASIWKRLRPSRAGEEHPLAKAARALAAEPESERRRAALSVQIEERVQADPALFQALAAAIAAARPEVSVRQEGTGVAQHGVHPVGAGAGGAAVGGDVHGDVLIVNAAEALTAAAVGRLLGRARDPFRLAEKAYRDARLIIDQAGESPSELKKRRAWNAYLNSIAELEGAVSQLENRDTGELLNLTQAIQRRSDYVHVEASADLSSIKEMLQELADEIERPSPGYAELVEKAKRLTESDAFKEAERELMEHVRAVGDLYLAFVNGQGPLTARAVRYGKLFAEEEVSFRGAAERLAQSARAGAEILGGSREVLAVLPREAKSDLQRRANAIEGIERKLEGINEQVRKGMKVATPLRKPLGDISKAIGTALRGLREARLSMSSEGQQARQKE